MAGSETCRRILPLPRKQVNNAQLNAGFADFAKPTSLASNKGSKLLLNKFEAIPNVIGLAFLVYR